MFIYIYLFLSEQFVGNFIFKWIKAHLFAHS